MSGTTPSSTTPPATTLQKATNAAVAGARDAPAFIASMEAVSPALASQLSGQNTATSLIPLANVLTSLAAGLSAKYALGWDNTTDVAIASAALFVGSYVWHRLSTMKLRHAVAATNIGTRP